MRMPPSSTEHHTCGTIFDKTCDMGGQRKPTAEYCTYQIPWIRSRSPRIVLISCLSHFYIIENTKCTHNMHTVNAWMQYNAIYYEFEHLSSITFCHFLGSSPTPVDQFTGGPAAQTSLGASAAKCTPFDLSNDMTIHLDYNVYDICIVWYMEYYLGMDTQLNPFPR